MRLEQFLLWVQYQGWVKPDHIMPNRWQGMITYYFAHLKE